MEIISFFLKENREMGGKPLYTDVLRTKKKVSERLINRAK